MIPIFISPVAGEPLDVFNAGPGAVHPLRSVRLNNDTGKYLPAGPMTILVGGTYAGDTLLAALGRKARRIVSYAVDQSVSVQAVGTWSSSVLLSCALNDGSLTLTHADDAHSGYRVVNRGVRSRSVLIRENRWSGWHVAAPVKRAKRRGGVDQFTLDVPGGQSVKLAILRRRVAGDQVYLVGCNRSALKNIMRRPHMPDAIVRAIKQAIELRQTAAHALVGLNTTLAHEARIQAYEAHLRRNLQALGKASTVYTSMAYDLAGQETLLAAARTVESQYRAAVLAAQANIAKFWKEENVPPAAAK
ncbi:MAG: hypothetical protein ACP5O7_12675 [Phycisphaerae bacterium]